MGEEITSDADTLNEFVYERGDQFIASDGTEWSITGFSWDFDIRYVEDRDGVPAREDHRIYRLGNREMETTRVSEADLHGWTRLDD